jgi:hypothetical protein
MQVQKAAEEAEADIEWEDDEEEEIQEIQEIAKKEDAVDTQQTAVASASGDTSLDEPHQKSHET